MEWITVKKYLKKERTGKGILSKNPISIDPLFGCEKSIPLDMYTQPNVFIKKCRNIKSATV